MDYFVVLLVASSIFTEGYCAKCMTPDDARYVTPLHDIPESWRNRGWHTGNYFPGPGSVSRSSFLTSQEFGALMWWLKDGESDLYTLLTKDQSHILCTLHGAGLQIGWQVVSKETKRSGYCHWTINPHPENPALFQLKNGELRNSISDIGSVFLNISGMYFDYATSSKNDPANRIDESLTWWKWHHIGDEQSGMETLPDQCELGASGLPLFMEQHDEIEGRSVGRRRRRSRFTLVSEDDFTRCGERWFLYGKKCYRIYTAPGLNRDRTAKVCKILHGRIVQPSSSREQGFVRALIRRFARGKEYWLAAHVPETASSASLHDFVDASEQRLRYTRWFGHRRLMWNHRCVLLNDSRWRPSSCDVTTGRVMCERDAVAKELPGSSTCGRIQERRVDAIMAMLAQHQKKLTRIVGGNEAQPTQFPWQAAIRLKKPVRISGQKVYHICGGALIDNCWVMTAAHCFHDRDKTAYVVRLGDLVKNMTDGTEQEFELSKLIIHEEYEPTPSHRKDIALLKLRKHRGECARLSNSVQPVCLPTPDNFPFDAEDVLCQVSGWGVTNTSEGQRSAANVLQYVTLPTIRNSICERRYNSKKPYFLPDIMFCAGHKEGGKDSCSGDSGGPLVCRGKRGTPGHNRYAVSGIVSFGIGCGRKVYPGVYTRVTEFIPWITEKIRAYGDGRVIG